MYCWECIFLKSRAFYFAIQIILLRCAAEFHVVINFQTWVVWWTLGCLFFSPLLTFASNGGSRQSRTIACSKNESNDSTMSVPEISGMSYFAIQIKSWLFKTQSKSNHNPKSFNTQVQINSQKLKKYSLFIDKLCNIFHTILILISLSILQFESNSKSTICHSPDPVQSNAHLWSVLMKTASGTWLMTSPSV